MFQKSTLSRVCRCSQPRALLCIFLLALTCAYPPQPGLPCVMHIVRASLLRLMLDIAIDKCQNVDGLTGFKFISCPYRSTVGSFTGSLPGVSRTQPIPFPSLASAWGKTMDSYSWEDFTGWAGKGCSLLLTSCWLELGHTDGKEAGKCRVAVCSGEKEKHSR